ncbi:hypothetical protein MRX96_059471 [Rhipicephalus microplus]
MHGQARMSAADASASTGSPLSDIHLLQQRFPVHSFLPQSVFAADDGTPSQVIAPHGGASIASTRARSGGMRAATMRHLLALYLCLFTLSCGGPGTMLPNAGSAS